MDNKSPKSLMLDIINRNIPIIGTRADIIRMGLVNARPGEIISSLSQEDKNILSNLKSSDLNFEFTDLDKYRATLAYNKIINNEYWTEQEFLKFDKRLKIEKFQKYSGN